MHRASNFIVCFAGEQQPRVPVPCVSRGSSSSAPAIGPAAVGVPSAHDGRGHKLLAV